MKRVTPFVALNIFNLLCWLVIAFPIAIMYKHLTGNLRLLLAFSEAGLLMLPALFVGKRWRWSALIPVWLVAIFYLTNFWYWRFFHDMMPFSSYFLWSNVDEHVYKTWFALIKPGDLALVIPVLLVTAFYLYPLRKLIALAPSYSKRLRIRGSLLILVYYVAMSHFYTTALRVKDLDFKPPFSAAYRTEFVKRWNVQWPSIYLDYLELNLTSYLGRQVYINLIYRPLFSHRVNDEEVKMVHDFWEAHTAYANDKSVDIQDSITAYPPP